MNINKREEYTAPTVEVFQVPALMSFLVNASETQTVEQYEDEKQTLFELEGYPY